ncbi:MAG TPA: aminoglycoside 6'-N-acetyltransferase [Burkholderiaceae bacterium]|nr:aminoglycoside 6'-N-acetyltransferase [Burkholderiaceae bacterium]
MSKIRVEVLTARGDPQAWLAMRARLWPDCPAEDHAREAEQMLHDPARTGVALAVLDDMPVGFIELTLRTDYVLGCEHSPVAFIEGLWTEPAARRQGVARALVAHAIQWARLRKVQELASDTPLSNLVSQAAHTALGFTETERVVAYKITL